MRSNKDNKVVATVGLDGQNFFRFALPNSQTYIATVDETRVSPALVASMLAIVERGVSVRTDLAGGATAGAAGLIVAKNLSNGNKVLL